MQQETPTTQAGDAKPTDPASSMFSIASGAAKRASDAAASVSTIVTTSVGGLAQVAQVKAQEFGVQDSVAWAASKSIEAKSASQNLLLSVLHEKLKGEFGEDIYEVFLALVEVTTSIAAEVGVANSKFGLMLALPLVHLHDDSKPPPVKMRDLPAIDLPGVNRAGVMNEASYWLHYATGAYGAKAPGIDDHTSVQRALGERAEVILATLPAKGVQCPGHFVAVDKQMQAVVLGIRGTVTTSDAITDAVGESVDVAEIPGLQCHKGMLVSARAVLERTKNAVAGELLKNPRFRLIVTGHSLGAGVSILTSMLLNATPIETKPRIKCWAFAPPPVVSSLTAPIIKDMEVYGFVNRHDVVPRLSLQNIYTLGSKGMAVDQLDLTLIERLTLIHRGKTPAAQQDHKEQVVSAVGSAVENVSKAPAKFVPMSVPGRVFWIDQPLVSADNKEKDEDAYQGNTNQTYEIQATQLQTLLLRGGTSMLTDHLCTSYKAGLEGVGATGAQADIDKLVAQTEAEIAASEKKAPKCCVLQ